MPKVLPNLTNLILHGSASQMLAQLNTLKTELQREADAELMASVKPSPFKYEQRTIILHGVRYTLSPYTLKGRNGKAREYWSILNWATHERRDAIGFPPKPFCTIADCVNYLKKKGVK